MSAALRRSFTSLSVPNYRRYFAGQLVSLTGNWMQIVAEMWLILSLTGSGVAVGITSALQFSSPVLAFGSIKLGEKAEKRIIVRGPQPFRITSIGGTDEAVTADAGGDTPKPVHVIVVGIKSANPGGFAHTLKIVTDLPDDHTADLPITANVVMPHVD